MDAYLAFDPTTIDGQLIGLLLVVVIVISLLTGFTVIWMNRRTLRRRDMVWLELIPPASLGQTSEAAAQFFAVIHGLRASRRLCDRLLRRNPVLSFEISSTRKAGIRFFIQVETVQSELLQKTIAAYIPAMKVRTVKRRFAVPSAVAEFAATSHFILPLALPSSGDQHDPLRYVIGAMTKLEAAEEISLQLIVQPVRLREAGRLTRQILDNENILEQVRISQWTAAVKFGGWLGRLFSALTDLTSDVYVGTAYGQSAYDLRRSQRGGAVVPAKLDAQPVRMLSSFERQLMETMHYKVNQPLFQVDLRVLVSSPQPKGHISAMKIALNGYSVPPYQSLRARRIPPFLQPLLCRRAHARLPSVRRRSSLILAASELAGLYHFPVSNNYADNLIQSLSKTLPAPASLKSGRKLDVLIGENRHHGITTPIGLTEAERQRHMYIIGGTGNGKTTMLFYSILQDIQSGNGVAIIDPHGDLAERLLRFIPEDRINDVIYMNPDDLSYPIGMNLLELTEGVTGDDLLREKDLITEAAISVLRKVFTDDDSGGHRVEYVLRNAIQTALTLKGSTLFTIFELLNDAKYRRKVVKGLNDKNLKDFWDNELGKAGEFQRVKMAAGITAKIGRFLFSASARRMLEQPKSTIDFADILTSRKILICNVSKGKLGEDTSALFGTTVLAKLQMAALRRARITERDRTPYYLYVDEFQNFATMSFVQMLSEARKYMLFLTMAEQSTSQQDQQRLVEIILANVGTIVCFRSGSPADERIVLPLFMPFVQQGEITNLPAYSYYVRIAAVDAQEPMSGVTVVVTDDGSTETAQRVIASSRRLYAKAGGHVPPEKQLAAVTVASTVARTSESPRPTRQVDETLAGARSIR